MLPTLKSIHVCSTYEVEIPSIRGFYTSPLLIQQSHTGGLKSAPVGVFTPWKLAQTACGELSVKPGPVWLPASCILAPPLPEAPPIGKVGRGGLGSFLDAICIFLL